MKQFILFIASCLLIFNVNAQVKNTGYQSLWDKVVEFEGESLPKSGLGVVAEIYQKASADGNGPEVIKSLIYRLKFETAIDQDALPGMMKEIEQIAEKSKEKVERSFLYSILAELYSKYYYSDRARIDQRTDLVDYIPNDIQEWTSKLFIDQIEHYIDLSIENTSLLQVTPIESYQSILNEGTSSRNIRPTVYDFLIYRSIALLNGLQSQKDFSSKILGLYRDLIGFREKAGNQQALLFVKLDQLKYAYQNSRSETKNQEYTSALENLREKYETFDYCIEIIYNLATHYYNNQSRFNNDDEAHLFTKKAYELCLEGVRLYPQYKRIGTLQNLLGDITRGNLSIRANNVVCPNSDLKLEIQSKNTNKITIEIYKIKRPISYYSNNWSRGGAYKEYGELILREELNLPNTYPYIQLDTTYSIPMNELGCYEYLIYTDNPGTNYVNKQFSVSRLVSLVTALKEERGFLVVDRISGKPIQGATIHLYEKNQKSNVNVKSNESAETNELGLAFRRTKDQNYSGYNVSYKNDTSLILNSVPYLYNDSDKEEILLSLFPDRSIYRPGQTVYFKGIVYQARGNFEAVIPGEKYTINLHDANGKIIDTKEFISNDYGSFNGEFTLPQGLRNGTFSLRSDKGSVWQSVQVEEYKRPNFEVSFTENTNTYQLGDEVEIKGNVKSFSGVSLEDTKLSYTISRQGGWPFFRRFSPPEQITAGEVRTDGSGNFKIRFGAEEGKVNPTDDTSFCTFTIEASITDSKGETQSNSTSVRIGKRSLLLSFSGFSTIIQKEILSELRINAVNLSMNPVKSTGEYKIYNLKRNTGTKDLLLKKKIPTDELEEGFDLEKYEIDKLIHKDTFDSEKTLPAEVFHKLPSGAYRIVASAKDDQNREVEAEFNFILGSTKDKRPPVQVYQWCLTPKTVCEVGEKAEIIFGTSAKNVYVLYQLFHEGRQVAASRFELNNQNKKIEIPFLESYGKGITASFIFIQDEKVYKKAIDILRKQENKKLDLKLEVFRDRLIPGQKEEWKISVKNGDKNPVVSELLAAMYDSSLDRILSHTWNFDPVPSVSLREIYFSEGWNFLKSYASLSYTSQNYIKVPGFSFDSFNWFGWNIRNQLLRTTSLSEEERGGSIEIAELSNHKISSLGAITSVNPDELKTPVSSIAELLGGRVSGVLDTQQADGASEFWVRGIPVSDTNVSDQPVQVRQNFNETAFFYPQLKTNEAGETLISFTLPESNTKWKFMALAHTKDLKSGQLLQEVISQKKLMVTPNMPRFIREGDRTTISATISNLSDQFLSGTVHMECFDPVTEKSNILISENSKTFVLEAGKTIPVSWTFDVPSGIDLSAVKIVAQTENVSDGEQHLVPVLPNRILVTESLPLNILGGQTKEFHLDKLAKNNSTTLENYSLTLEFTSNPIWYAVQALPTLTNPTTENVISWFAAYYGNTFAAYIAQSTPKLRQIIDIWTKDGGSKETLLSNLEKNTELKMVLLEETPWVLQTENETEQKQRLSLLFDMNLNTYQSNQALEKLQSLQAWEGGWSWFPGMEANVSITQWILHGMGNLREMNTTTFPDEISEMQQKAVVFIDKKFLTHFENLKKNNKNWQNLKTISTYELEYLRVRSMYPEAVQESAVAEASDFYLNIVKNNWTKITDIYNRTISVMVLNRNGESKIAGSIIKSLREHASHKEETGMYWANLNARAFMFQSATAIHTFVMEAFHETGASAKEMDEMKLWLLKQKQVQQWESTPATLSAIYILLKTGSNWLESEKDFSIQWGNQPVDVQNSETGTAYIKETLSSTSITPDKARIEITKKDQGPAWGALYWQYFENMDKVSSSKTGLNIEKSLFVERIIEKGKELVPVNSQNRVKVGDKMIVRLTVRSDRDFEYIQLKDMRASAFEPVEQLSGTAWKQNVVYYQSTKDASMNYYFYNLPKGTYVFEYTLYANRPGEYSAGNCTIQCLYAPEFISHTAGERITIEYPTTTIR